MIREFTGTALERGRQHGESLRDQIRARIARTLPADRAASAGPWLAAIDRLGDRPPLGAELRGIAAGAGVPLADVVLLNAFEAVEVARQVELGGCTAVAVGGAGGAVLARTGTRTRRSRPPSRSTCTAGRTSPAPCWSPRPAASAGSA